MAKTVSKKDNKKVVKKTTTKPNQKKETVTNKIEKLKTGTINEGITKNNGKPLTSKTTITNKPVKNISAYGTTTREISPNTYSNDYRNYQSIETNKPSSSTSNNIYSALNYVIEIKKANDNIGGDSSEIIINTTNNSDDVYFSKPIYSIADEGNVSVTVNDELEDDEQSLNINQSLEDVINDINSLFTDEKKNTIINNIVRQYGQTYIAIEKANSFGTGFSTCWEIMLKEINNLKNKQ